MKILWKIDKQLEEIKKEESEKTEIGEEGKLLRELIYRVLEVRAIGLKGAAGFLDISMPLMTIFIDDSKHQSVEEIDMIEKGIRETIRATVKNRVARDILREAIQNPEKIKITIKREG